jgi:hypothetical protein
VAREGWTVDWEGLRTPLGLPGQRQAICMRTSFMPLTEDLAERPAEVHYWATSAPPEQASPEQLRRAIREHWGIENGLHHVKDRTWLEDRHWVKNKRTGAMVSMLRSLACCLVRRARGRGLKKDSYCPERIEYFSAHPQRALALVTRSLRL